MSAVGGDHVSLRKRQLQGLAAEGHVRGVMVPVVLHRIEQHALRSAQGPNRLQPPVANAVVNRPARHAEQLGGMVQRDAATDTGFKAGVSHTRTHRHLSSRMHPISARRVPERRRGAGHGCKSLPGWQLLLR